MGNECPKCQTNNSDTVKFCGECGTKLTSADNAQVSFTKTLETPSEGISPGSTFALRYKIEKELGRGGMGIVYKAEDAKLKRTVAIKLLPPKLTEDKEARERFIREAQSAAVLAHPNICTIYEVDESEDKTFISMAYVDGQNLRESIKAGPLKINEGLNLGIQAAEGLAAAHKKGIVHRDIKSANIMVDSQGQVKIMDFGLAKFVGSSLITREGVTMGTVAYMSPEQAQGKAVDHRSDIWSLGVVLYEMFGGRLPFQGETEASFLYSIAHEDPTPLKEVNSDIPIDIQKVISRALKKKPEARYQSAEEMASDLKQFFSQVQAEEAGLFNLSTLFRRLRQPKFGIPAVLALALISAATFWFFNRQANIRWAKEQGLQEIAQLLEEDNFTDAFRIAQQAEKYIPEDSKLFELLPRIERTFSAETSPPGAEVYIRDYKTTEGEWEFLGNTPIENTRISRAFKRWKIIKEGFETVEETDSIDPQAISGGVSDIKISLKLDEKGSIPSEMVKIVGINYTPTIFDLSNLGAVQLETYFLDKYEVTNKQFKVFLDSGGYREKKYWKHKFMKEERVLSWEQAMAEFVDATGRLGPATWEFGDYSDGQDNFPVTGVSWYEAAAYAEFSGKNLPSVYHWDCAAGLGNSEYIVPLSNFERRGIVPTGSNQGISPFGTYDMAGNVKEWCWNGIGSRRYILGGAWNEAQYMFLEAESLSPFYRTQNCGFRCMKFKTEQTIPQKVFDPVPEIPPEDYRDEEPCSDEIFAVYKSLYAYDKTELDPVVESAVKLTKYWIMEKATFNAAYGNERMIAYIFLPRIGTPPYQTIIYFPGALFVPSIEDYPLDWVDIFAKDGRVIVFPVFKGTFERGYDIERKTQRDMRDYRIMWSKDLGRTIDYLETRTEFDSNKFAFFGVSWGAILGAILPAVEKRLKAIIIMSGAFSDDKNRLPEVKQVNFAPRVTAPVLMLNGRYDYMMPYETHQKPLFDLFGTPEKDKHHVLFETGHYIWSSIESFKEILNFLDRYLGPVK